MQMPVSKRYIAGDGRAKHATTPLGCTSDPHFLCTANKRRGSSFRAMYKLLTSNDRTSELTYSFQFAEIPVVLVIVERCSDFAQKRIMKSTHRIRSVAIPPVFPSPLCCCSLCFGFREGGSVCKFVLRLLKHAETQTRAETR